MPILCIHLSIFLLVRWGKRSPSLPNLQFRNTWRGNWPIWDHILYWASWIGEWLYFVWGIILALFTLLLLLVIWVIFSILIVISFIIFLLLLFIILFLFLSSNSLTNLLILLHFVITDLLQFKNLIFHFPNFYFALLSGFFHPLNLILYLSHSLKVKNKILFNAKYFLLPLSFVFCQFFAIIFHKLMTSWFAIQSKM